MSVSWNRFWMWQMKNNVCLYISRNEEALHYAINLHFKTFINYLNECKN